MTREEIRQHFKQIEKSKQEIPPFYDELLRHYQRYLHTRQGNDAKINLLYYELEGVKGLDYTREKGTYNKDAHIEKYYSISDQISELEKQNRIIDNCLKGLELIRDSIKDSTLKAKVTQCYFYNLFG